FSSYLVGTENEDGGSSDLATYAELDYPNDIVRARVQYVGIGSDVDPALGFVPRTGIHRYEGEFRWLPRPGTSIRQAGVGYRPTLVTGRDGSRQSESHAFTLADVTWESGERLRLFARHDREVLLEEFEISDGVVIPVDDYAWWRAGGSIRTSERRPWDARLSSSVGDFFDGQRLDISGSVAWRPSRYLTLDLDYQWRDVDLPSGAFDVHLARLRADVSLNQWISILNFIQYDTATDGLGLNSRLRWIVSPGNEFFFVVNQGWEAGSGEFAPRSGQVATKLGWTFRF
ncbi:MAG: hypothetical protein ACYSWX_11715, partial [Planctomycetota bacterium]